MGGRTGTKKLPTEVKRLKGTLEKHRENKNEPDFGEFDNNVPDFLSDEGKRAFVELSKILGDSNVLQKGDRIALTLLCDAYSEYRLARDKVQENLTYETTTAQGDKMKRVDPHVGIASDAWKRVMKGLSDFGLTPASRSNVSAKEKPDKDPFEEFLKNSN